jgi:predicted secreted protein
MSDAIAGLGTKFRRWNADSGTWETLAEIINIDGPSMSRETVDVTTLDTEDYREFIGSLRDAGDISFSMNFTRAAYELMKNDFEDNNAKNYEIVLPDVDVTTLEFEGLVTELPLSIEVDSQISADVTIKISGAVVLNSGSGSGV